jgi:phosphoribosylamine--glycine ligase
MKVLVIGGGGREHALVWKIKQSPLVSQVYCVPGNGGICTEAECLPGSASNIDSLIQAAARIQPDLTVVGPEVPLSMGIVDEFTRRGWRTFGPTQAAAQLESSKSFAKEFMQRYRIPTAKYAICTSQDEVKEALAHFSVVLVSRLRLHLARREPGFAPAVAAKPARHLSCERIVARRKLDLFGLGRNQRTLPDG